MSTLTRRLVGLLWLAVLVGAGFALIRIGSYGLTIFVLFPVFLGALTSWVFRPTSGSQAAGWGALATLVALFSLLLVAWEGVVCIGMVMPLALPLGALGGWLVYRGGSSSVTKGSIAMLLLAPSATMTWDATAPPPVFQVRSTIEIAAPPEQVWKYVVSFPELSEPQE